MARAHAAVFRLATAFDETQVSSLNGPWPGQVPQLVVATRWPDLKNAVHWLVDDTSWDVMSQG
jgi:hypothetical protein